MPQSLSPCLWMGRWALSGPAPPAVPRTSLWSTRADLQRAARQNRQRSTGPSRAMLALDNQAIAVLWMWTAVIVQRATSTRGLGWIREMATMPRLP